MSHTVVVVKQQQHQQSLVSQFREWLGAIIAPTLVEQRDNARRESETNPVSKLANRSAYNRAEKTLTPSDRVLVFDADNFGRVNKAPGLGHKIGDRLIRKFGKVLSETSKNYKARVFHFGGDEFVVICNWQFAERLRNRVELEIGVLNYNDFCVSMTGEIGATFDEADAILQRRKAIRKSTY